MSHDLTLPFLYRVVVQGSNANYVMCHVTTWYFIVFETGGNMDMLIVQVLTSCDC